MKRDSCEDVLKYHTKSNRRIIDPEGYGTYGFHFRFALKFYCLV